MSSKNITMRGKGKVQKQKDVRMFNYRVSPIPMDWDKARTLDISTGAGFRVTEQGATDSKPAGYHSIHSPLFGSTWEDDRAFMDRYSCKCPTKTLIGKKFEGQVCPVCGEKVTFIDIDMEKTAWIVFEEYQIIQSLFYKKIHSFIGKQAFPEIIKYIEPEDRQPTANNPYAGYGLLEFREHFDQIMSFFVTKNKKWEAYIFLMANKERIFTSSIPVFSSHLRLYIVQGDDIKFTKEDEIYNRLFANSELLNKPHKLEQKIKRKRNKKDVFKLRKENILYSIQKDLNTLWDRVFDTIDKKTGHINDQILGGRLNYTARNVIIPGVDLRPDQVKIGYITFLEMFKLEIINILQDLYSMTPVEAHDLWFRATITYNDKVYRVMKYMIQKKKLYVLINRNPTINYGSEVVLQIVDIGKDPLSHTMSLPILILTKLNADLIARSGMGRPIYQLPSLTAGTAC